jgi:hypothetical protein
MNTSFRHGAPTTPEAEVEFRAFMRECAALGIQVLPYLSYGGDGVAPWPPASVRAVSRIQSEPNLLAWYVGDDIIDRSVANEPPPQSIYETGGHELRRWQGCINYAAVNSMKHLDGIRQTVTILRETAPTIPTVVDYIAKETPEAKTIFTQYVDVRPQYDYPIPKRSFAAHLRYFEQRVLSRLLS